MSKHPKKFTYNSEKKKRAKAQAKWQNFLGFVRNHPESEAARLYRGEAIDDAA